MNLPQRFIILIGTLLIVAMCIYPPWMTDYPAGERFYFWEYNYIYPTLFRHIGSEFHEHYKIDLSRLGVQIFGVLSGTVGFSLVFSSKGVKGK